MKNTKRALRRHHRQRMIQRAMRSYVLSGENDLAILRRRALRWYDNLQMCSCYMCGNPRTFYNEPPAQERRLDEAARYEVAQFLSEGRY